MGMVERSSGRHSCGKGDKMIRITQLKLPINHTKEQLDKAIAAFEKVGKELEVI